MNLELTQQEILFRQEVREFINEHFPWHLKVNSAYTEVSREHSLTWHQILGKKGWSVPLWPTEYGGTGWTPMQQYIWREENARAGTTPLLPFGVGMVGPVIYTFGTEQQKQRFLPGIRSGDVWWCQGYSEPGAGSDLAALTTSAVREGDYYRVNGQKAWTSHAQYADWGFFLVRTDPAAAKPQQGISFLLIDMKSPGVSVRPTKLIDGSYEVNDVFLEDVMVPVENRIGEENKGWSYAKFLLAHERSTIAEVARSESALKRLREIATAEFNGNGLALITDDTFACKLARLEIDLLALKYSELRLLTADQSDQVQGPEPSLLKIIATEIQQGITELTLQAVCHYGAVDIRSVTPSDAQHRPFIGEYAGIAAPDYFNRRKVSIYGGSNEIQRSIIAKMILG